MFLSMPTQFLKLYWHSIESLSKRSSQPKTFTSPAMRQLSSRRKYFKGAWRSIMKKFFAMAAAAVLAIGLSSGVMADPNDKGNHKQQNNKDGFKHHTQNNKAGDKHTGGDVYDEVPETK